MAKNQNVLKSIPTLTPALNKQRVKPRPFHKRIEQIIGYGFILPTVILLSMFVFYPFLQSVYLSFFMTDPLGNIVGFVGLQNYVDLFTSKEFLGSLKTTFLFAIFTVPTGIFISLLLAVLTHNKLKGMRIFQFIFALPIAMSVGTSSIIWLLLFNPTSGVLNYLLNLVGLESIQWLTDPNWALVSVSMMTIWLSLGLDYIILLAGLQAIPKELYESAKIDGAGSFRIFSKITIPMLSPTIFFVLIISVIQALQAFGQFNILTGGGPMKSTNVFVFSLYQEAFVNFQFGLGSTRAFVLFVIILLFTWIQFKFGEKKVHYQ
ncbi:sugar ABC transporter permease [Aquibacillus koreensis]|uniref:Sugar ABC transporter permease n=1 Tax=Aquibacillus koreensis TaxID=279446 RepID=A0A9X3WHM9_9BACI|nr:sugar ABC transporter permease [Aquibacillus koreensis]MCT2537117.1 sugar ABC transporter permease [Aquibacillus koreensis]MDC3419900.1 sugar ABC transporter permease [Aquibacillus koreensis]